RGEQQDPQWTTVMFPVPFCCTTSLLSRRHTGVRVSVLLALRTVFDFVVALLMQFVFHLNLKQAVTWVSVHHFVPLPTLLNKGMSSKLKPLFSFSVAANFSR